MKTNGTIRLLCTEQDREKLQPILDALAVKGLRAAAGEPGRDDVTLAALSESFYADKEKTDKLLALVGAGAEKLFPLRLDEAPVPETLMNALYSRNIVSAEGRDAGLIAERIAAALPQKKSGLPKLLIVAGVALLAVIGLLLWRGQRQDAVPAMSETVEEPAVYPLGLTQEDLEQIEIALIVGDRAEFYRSDEIGKGGHRPEWDEFAYRNYDQDEAHYYSREDGHEYPMTRYEDLSFLSLMPKLSQLYLCKVDLGTMPDLTAATRLRSVMLGDCVISDLEWLRGSSVTHVDLLNSTGSYTDYSPLTSCEKLREVHIDLIGAQEADCSGFCPPKLEWLWINNGQQLRSALDLSALKACTALKECQLDYELPIEDLSFLAKAESLDKLRVNNLRRLRDISALGGLKKLRELKIEEDNAISDFSGLAGCTGLEYLQIDADWERRLRDASFLTQLPNIRTIELHGVDLPDLEFLRVIGAYNRTIDLSLSGSAGDYSALEAINNYNRLTLEPSGGDSLDRITPWLQNATIAELTLRNFSSVDLSTLPRAKSRVELDRCGITDLGTMPEDWRATRLNLNKCSTLRSLSGLEKQKRIGQNGLGNLEIYNCPRLSDWSALEGMDMSSLRIAGGFTLPDFKTLTLGSLQLDRVADIVDLHFLDEMQVAHALDVELIGLDELTSLEPLRRFHGRSLAVPPQLAEQAEDLVKSGNYYEYRVVFPEGGWDLDQSELSLLSLDELETMPPAMLRRVERLCLVGDTVVDLSSGDIWENWDNGRPTLVYHRWNSDELTPIVYGSGFENLFEMLSPLTGLRNLQIYAQPLKNLDGIQNFQNLVVFGSDLCPDLSDASAAFACPQLCDLRLDNCEVTSIQGVQNLRDLEHLNINNTKVDDLSPLTECDFSVAGENGDLALFLNNLPVEDYSPLQGLPLRRLDINDTDPERFLPFIEEAPLRSFQACNSFIDRGGSDPNALFAEFVRSHPQLEELNLSWNQGISDLTPLLELENLQEVRVSRDMEQAIRSIEGQGYSFRLEIEG